MWARRVHRFDQARPPAQGTLPLRGSPWGPKPPSLSLPVHLSCSSTAPSRARSAYTPQSGEVPIMSTLRSERPYHTCEHGRLAARTAFDRGRAPSPRRRPGTTQAASVATRSGRGRRGRVLRRPRRRGVEAGRGCRRRELGRLSPVGGVAEATTVPQKQRRSRWRRPSPSRWRLTMRRVPNSTRRSQVGHQGSNMDAIMRRSGCQITGQSPMIGPMSDRPISPLATAGTGAGPPGGDRGRRPAGRLGRQRPRSARPPPRPRPARRHQRRAPAVRRAAAAGTAPGGGAGGQPEHGHRRARRAARRRARGVAAGPRHPHRRPRQPRPARCPGRHALRRHGRRHQPRRRQPARRLPPPRPDPHHRRPDGVGQRARARAARPAGAPRGDRPPPHRRRADDRGRPDPHHQRRPPRASA